MPLNGFTRSSIVLALTASALCACSSRGGNDLKIKSSSIGEKEIAVKSAYALPLTKTFTDVNGKMTTAITYNVYAANYDLDAANFAMTIEKPLTSEDHLRVMFSLVGPEGTKDNARLQTGTYSAKAEKYMKLESVGIVSRKGSIDSKTWFDRAALNGDVRINSVTDEHISGDIDMTAGDNSIKGSFTAKILKRR